MLLIGLVGGLAMGAIAAARRTQSSFPAYLASTNPSDVTVLTAYFDPAVGSNAGYDPAIVRTVARLPHVKRVATATIFNADVEALRSLHTHFRAGQQPPTLLGSIDGEFSAVDRVTVTQGRQPNPNRVDEAVISAGRLGPTGCTSVRSFPWGSSPTRSCSYPIVVRRVGA